MRSSRQHEPEQGEPGPHAIHRLGDGQHPLPVWRIVGREPQRVDSTGCVLLLFTCWADERGHDAVETYARACPEVPMLRPDLLLFFLPWVEMPDRVDTSLLCHDLVAVGEHRLAEVVQQIRAGHWQPPDAFTHWVVTEDGRIAGEARGLDPPDAPDPHGQHFCFVRLFGMADLAEWGYADAASLRSKTLARPP